LHAYAPSTSQIISVDAKDFCIYLYLLGTQHVHSRWLNWTHAYFL